MEGKNYIVFKVIISWVGIYEDIFWDILIYFIILQIISHCPIFTVTYYFIKYYLKKFPNYDLFKNSIAYIIQNVRNIKF